MHAIPAAHLRALAHRAARAKRRAPDVAAVLLDVDRAVDALACALADRSYRPGVGRFFRIADPKPRSIYALPFRDRVAQHLLIDATLPAIERGLAPQTYACREGLGTHRGLAHAAPATCCASTCAASSRRSITACAEGGKPRRAEEGAEGRGGQRRGEELSWVRAWEGVAVGVRRRGARQLGGVWTTRLMPRRRTGTLKVISRPWRRRVAFRYETTWLTWTGASCSTALSSTTTR